MTVFLSYLPEAGQYSCMFLYLKQVSALNHLLYIIFFKFCVIKEGQNITCVHVLDWIEIYDQLKFTKYQSASCASIRLQDNINNKEVLSFLWNSTVNIPSECAKIFYRCEDAFTMILFFITVSIVFFILFCRLYILLRKM